MATGHFEQECLLERLHHYAPAVTQTTQRVWRIAKQLHMNITVPKSETQDWVSMEASSARAKRRAKVWLEYLLWLAYLNEGSAGTERRRIVVLVTKLSSVKVLVRSKLGSIYNRGLKSGVMLNSSHSCYQQLYY